jgi:phosphatidylserine/phosphatidylglycerophosphate/cardiolipin synthase-like enzyme
MTDCRHDVAVCVGGDAALDAAQHFCQRWTCHVKDVKIEVTPDADSEIDTDEESALFAMTRTGTRGDFGRSAERQYDNRTPDCFPENECCFFGG